MTIKIKINKINSSNDFKIFLKEGETPYPIYGDEYISYGDFSGGIMEILFNNISFKKNTKYWVKLLDKKTNKLIIENIKTLYFEEQPTPTPTSTVTPTPTNTPISVTPTPTSTVTPTPTSTPVSDGICYELNIPSDDLTSGGLDLYVTYKIPGGLLQDTAVKDLPNNSGGSDFLGFLCSVEYPIYKYGESGAYISDPGWTTTEGTPCSVMGDCIN